MYCPQCGQPQASGEIRFCSRCGFPLIGVAQLMAQGGNLLTGMEPGAVPGKPISPRRRGVRQGAILFFLGFVLTPIFAILSETLRLPEALIGLCAVITFVGGLFRMLFAAIFEEGAPRPAEPAPYLPPSAHRPPAPLAAPDQRALPPQQSVPATLFNAPRRNTSEIAAPPSVTENTTRLLKDLPDSDRTSG